MAFHICRLRLCSIISNEVHRDLRRKSSCVYFGNHGRARSISSRGVRTTHDKWNQRQLPSKEIPLVGGLLASLGLVDEDEEKKEDPVVTNIKHGIFEMRRNDYKKSEAFLHIALRLSQQRVDYRAETYCYSVLGDLAFQKKDYTKAEKLYLEVMKRRITSGSTTDSNEIVELSLKLAQIYGEKNDSERAMQGFQFCIDTQKKKIQKLKPLPVTSDEAVSEDDLDTWLLYGMSMELYGRYLTKKKCFKEARELFKTSYDICSKIQGSTHPQSLSIYNQMAFTNLYLGDYKGAATMFEEVVAKSAKDSEDLPIYLCNLGSVYAIMGDLENARKNCKKAKKKALELDLSEAVREAQDCLNKTKPPT